MLTEILNDCARVEKEFTMIAAFISYSHRDEDFRNELEVHLAMLLKVGVVPARPCRPRLELVDKNLSWLYRRLADPRHAIHGRRDVDAVPVDRGRLRERVLEDDADALPFFDTDLWPGHLPVIGHGLDLLSWRQLPRDLARFEVDGSGRSGLARERTPMTADQQAAETQCGCTDS